ncbi:MAG: Ig-like domain-containing protein [Gammaproteobacteria bacterium]
MSDTKCSHRCVIGLAIVLLSGAALFAITGCGGSGGAGDSAITAPTATAGHVTATAGMAASGTLTATGGGSLSYSISVPPQDGSASLTDASTGAFTYTSYTNFTGTDTFQFTVKNSVGASGPATETIMVTPGVLGAQQAVANIGVSTDWLCYWCTAQPFVNILQEAANFADRNNSGMPLYAEGKLDANGWPEEDFEVLVVYSTSADNSPDDPGTAPIQIGAYQLSFNGIATIKVNSYGTLSNQSYAAATNTTTATVNVTNGPANSTSIYLIFSNTQRTASSPLDSGLTNIKLIRPQYAPNGAQWWSSPTQEFTTPFLNSFKGFSTIRYINWTAVINSPEVNWSDRTPGDWPVAGAAIIPPASSLTYLSGTGTDGYFSTGASWESAIDLANATHTDMWINIPVMATDDYVKSLAALIQSKLDPGLHVYFEWSDEIWNYGNPFWTETDYNADQLTALLASNPTEAANYAANCATWAQFECHVAERVMQFGDDFASVYGQSAINTTIRPLLCTQVVQPSMMQEALGFVAAVYGPPSHYFYGICGAPYWSPASALPSGTTEAGVVAALDQSINNNASYIESDAATALYYGLHNFTYEGGPAIDGVSITGTTGTPLTAILDAADVDPAMKTQVTNGLTDAFQGGIDMYMYYSSQGSGSHWGATPDALDLDAPKFAGLTALAGQLVTRNAGVAVPGDIPINPPLIGIIANGTVRPTFEVSGAYCEPASNGASSYCAFNTGVAAGEGYGYVIDVPQAGTYALSVVMDDRSGEGPGSLELDMDRQSLGTLTVPKTPSGTPLTLGPLSVTLTPGLHLVELLNAGSGGFAVDSIQVNTQ